jgi:N-acetyl-D-muramate 6-phosphate phosphatase
MTTLTRPKALLFDLDGTLLDTAPDLVGTLLHLRRIRGLPESDESTFRSFATRGALGLLEAGFAGNPDINPAELRDEFLAHYAANLWVRSRPFDGVEALLDVLADAGLAMAVVTNKVEALARPVLEQAGWQQRFDCLVAGDSTPRSKPHPDPVLEACRQLGIDPVETIFIGDDHRDVLAGQAAGSATIVAGWGYLPPGDDGRGWGADAVIEHPLELTGLLNLEGMQQT